MNGNQPTEKFSLSGCSSQALILSSVLNYHWCRWLPKQTVPTEKSNLRNSSPPPLFFYPRGRCTIRKCKEMAKGRRETVQSMLCCIIECLMLMPLREMRATARLGKYCNSGSPQHRRHPGGNLISHSAQGSLVSNRLESHQMPAPEDGVILTLSGDDTRLGLSYEYVSLFLARNE